MKPQRNRIRAMPSVSTCGRLLGTQPAHVVVLLVTVLSASCTDAAEVTDVCGAGDPGCEPHPVSAVVVRPNDATLVSLGETIQLDAAAFDASARAIPNRTFTWSSSEPGIATVDSSSGLVTAVADGSTVIAASTGGVDGTANISVGQVVATIYVSPSPTALAPDEAVQLSSVVADALGNSVRTAALAWHSSNATVAAVDTTGHVRGLSPGTVTITAASSGATGDATVSVLTPGLVTVRALLVDPTIVGVTGRAPTADQFHAAYREAVRGMGLGDGDIVRSALAAAQTLSRAPATGTDLVLLRALGLVADLGLGLVERE